LFADDFYLQHWSGNLSVADGVSNQPVTNVSWYAAQSYAAWNGQRLPSAFEWDSNKEKLEKSSVQWEWVSDFQSSLPQGNSRTICGGEIDASDPAASFRRSILGHQTTPDLGFRCANNMPVEGIVRQTKTQQSSASDVPSDSIYNLSHSWTKHDSTQLKLSDFKGEIVITSMMFSSCQAACPRLMRELEKIKNSIPQELSSKIKWLLISFDPDVDTPQVLSKFAASYNLNQQWSLLNGNKAAVRDVATAMGVRYLQLEDGSYSHTNVISLLNRDGQIACQLNELGTTQEAFISLVLEQLRNQ
ncbi:MAG: SCO family protein, partial [Planctomycetota bacterium]|nr:SCO family protein [Planctomycetota bacterium]